MRTDLFNLCRRYADAHADRSGLVVTPVPGLTIIRALRPAELQAAINRPLIAMLLQGRKRVTTGSRSFEYGPGEAMVIAADVPTSSQIIQASLRHPYYSLVLELDTAILRELQDAAPAEQGDMPRVGIEPIGVEVTDAAYRLARLFEQREAMGVLGEGLRRELHYWLLRSVHGAAIRALGAADSHSGRISRAVAILRKDFTRAISVDELAGAAGIAQAAYAVGYASIPQFTREYARMFGTPPGRDMRAAKESI